MAREGHELTRQWETLNRDGRNYVFGNQLADQDRDDGWEPIQANDIFPAIMQEISMLAQRRVVPHAEPQEQGSEADARAAQSWGPVLLHWYEHDVRVPEVGIQWLLEGKCAGHWIVKLAWDPHFEWIEPERKWRGAVRAFLLRTGFVSVDPGCQRPDFRDAEYVRVAREVPVAQLLKQYPRFKAEILEAGNREHDAASDGDLLGSLGYSSDYMPSLDTLGDGDIDGRLAALLGTPSQFITRRTASDDTDTPHAPVAATKVTIEEFWWRDPEEITEVVPGEPLEVSPELMGDDDVAYAEDGVTPLTPEMWPREPETKRKVPRFPFGRYIIRVGHKTILNAAVDSQVWPYRYWGVVAGQNTPLPFTWRGMNAVEMVRKLQDWKNRTYTYLLDFLKNHVVPALVIEEGALADGQKIEEGVMPRAGRIILAAKGMKDAIGPLQRQELSSTVWPILDRIVDQIRDLLGMQVTGLGKQASRGMTAHEASNLAAQSQLRTAMQSACWDQFLMRLHYVSADIMQHEMKPGDALRLVSAGRKPGRADVDEPMLATPTDISLSTTSSLPFDRQRKQQDVVGLLGALAHPAATMVLEQILDTYQVANKDEIMLEFAASQRAKAQQEQASASAQPGGGEWGNKQQIEPEQSLPQTGNM